MSEDRLTPELKKMRRLWCAVFAQAVRDMHGKMCSALAQAEKQQAQTWLAGDSKDFYEVCDLAGINPEAFKSGQWADRTVNMDALQGVNGLSEPVKRRRFYNV